MPGPSFEHRAFIEASLGIIMSVIMADGKYTEDEFLWFRQVQNRHPLYRDVPPEEFNPMLRRVKAQLVSQPWKVLVTEWAAAVPKEYRVGVFQLATELVVVDGELEGKEPEVIRHLWHELGIPDDVARKIFMDRIERM